MASNNPQNQLNLLSTWHSEWRIIINTSNSYHVTFTLRKGVFPPLVKNVSIIPIVPYACYLSMLSDKRLKKKTVLNWACHVKSKTITAQPMTHLFLSQTKNQKQISKINNSLYLITGAHFYVPNHTRHSDLHTNTVS